MARTLQAIKGPADGGYVTDDGGAYVYLELDEDGDPQVFPTPGPDRGLYVRWVIGFDHAFLYAGAAGWVCECGDINWSGTRCGECGARRTVTA